MVDLIYFETAIKDNQLYHNIRQKFPQAQTIEIEKYSEVFNLKAQNFRIQKNNPALILAKKENNLVLKTPEGFGIGGSHNYYFSHLLNCPYDCRYCFLQGLYSSANYVLFVNYEDFHKKIKEIDEKSKNDTYFFSGYDADSLAFDSITEFCDNFLCFFNSLKSSKLELRSKSTQIRSLLRHNNTKNIITAFSFTPAEISTEIEHGVPKFRKRLEAIEKLAKHGYQIGLRFDPLIYCENYEKYYSKMIADIFAILSKDEIHSISIGPMRFPEKIFKKIKKLYPNSKLLSSNLNKNADIISYDKEIEKKLNEFVINEINKKETNLPIFNCLSYG